VSRGHARSSDAPSLGYNQRANPSQGNANKRKQNGFHLLSFIFPNRDFSMGYGRKNKKIRLRLKLARQVVDEMVQTACGLVLRARLAPGSDRFRE
jgi:hypothetical protein